MRPYPTVYDIPPRVTWRARDFYAYNGMQGPGNALVPIGQYGGAWGQEEQTEQSSGSVFDLVRDALPQLESWSQLAESVSDPARQVAVLRSQLQAALASGASLQKIELLKGKLAAAEARLQRQQETNRSVRAWRTVGMLAAVGGIALLGAITFSVLARTLYRRRRR